MTKRTTILLIIAAATAVFIVTIIAGSFFYLIKRPQEEQDHQAQEIENYLVILKKDCQSALLPESAAKTLIGPDYDVINLQLKKYVAQILSKDRCVNKVLTYAQAEAILKKASQENLKTLAAEMLQPELSLIKPSHVVKIKNDCLPLLYKYREPSLTITLLVIPGYSFVGLKLTNEEADAFKKHSCVESVLTAQEAWKAIQNSPPEVKKQIWTEIIKQHIGRTLNKDDIINKDALEAYLKTTQARLPKTKLSRYQLFITPDNPEITKLAEKVKGLEQTYQQSLQWVWVSDELLTKKQEEWLMPEEFLINTPNYKANPVKGRIASDCSEQANTLVSLFRALNLAPELVRVVLGKVQFDDNVIGHAWVQVFDGDVWIDLDPSLGDYWDEQEQKLIKAPGPSPYYFKFFPYPAVETWVYYNDVYFYDLETKQGNAPLSWLVK